jgi:transposase
MKSKLPRLLERSVKTISPPWADKFERHSLLFESATISLLLAIKNQTQPANLMRCKFDVVNRILHNATIRGLDQIKLIENAIVKISIDEKSFQKGHIYATVLRYPQGERVLDVEKH